MVIAGGGLAGLAAAVHAARAGLRVALIERAAAPGGMARSSDLGGVRVNMGPRALYPPAARLLDELKIPCPGGVPSLTGYALRDGKLHSMARGIGGLLAPPLFSESSARAAGQALGALVGADRDALAGVTLDAWIAERGLDENASQFLRALVRIASYINAPDAMSSAAAAQQLAESPAGVRYVDGGWQTIVDGLAQAARDAGVEFVVRSRATKVLHHDAGVAGLALEDGREIVASAVILAVAPDEARELLAPAGASVPDTVPVQAAVLDVTLSSLPNAEGGYLVALDRPLYLSVHSLAARFGPAAETVIHVARYLHPHETPDAGETRAELEWLLDEMQPGWRDMLLRARFLQHMTVTHALPAAATGGMPGRPPVAVDGLTGAYLAGDWVGSEHQLAAAALASAKAAASLAIRHIGGGLPRAAQP